jgi:hypothetical protein
LSEPLRDRKPLKCIKMIPRGSTTAVVFRLITGKSSYREYSKYSAMVLGIYALFNHV